MDVFYNEYKEKNIIIISGKYLINSDKMNIKFKNNLYHSIIYNSQNIIIYNYNLSSIYDYDDDDNNHNISITINNIYFPSNDNYIKFIYKKSLISIISNYVNYNNGYSLKYINNFNRGINCWLNQNIFYKSLVINNNSINCLIPYNLFNNNKKINISLSDDQKFWTNSQILNMINVSYQSILNVNYSNNFTKIPMIYHLKPNMFINKTKISSFIIIYGQNFKTLFNVFCHFNNNQYNKTLIMKISNDIIYCNLNNISLLHNVSIYDLNIKYNQNSLINNDLSKILSPSISLKSKIFNNIQSQILMVNGYNFNFQTAIFQFIFNSKQFLNASFINSSYAMIFVHPLQILLFEQNYSIKLTLTIDDDDNDDNLSSFKFIIYL